MGYEYKFLGFSLLNGRLFSIEERNKKDFFPMKLLKVEIPIIALNNHTESLGETEYRTCFYFKTGFFKETVPDIGFTSYGVFLFGFGFTLTKQESF